MNWIVKIIAAHIVAAWQQGWKTTVVGCFIAAIGALQAAVPLMQGHAIDQIDWNSILTKVVTAIGLVLAKDITLEKIIVSVPKAESVNKQ